MARPSRDDPLVLPDWLSALLAREGSADQGPKITGRLRSFGVASLDHEGSESDPSALMFRTPRFRGRAPLNQAREQPVTAALASLIEELSVIDAFVRLRLAASDMETVAHCARDVARYRHVPGADGPVPHNPYAVVEDVLEAGLVVVYARSFTGDASLGKRWRPEGEDDVPLHDALMAARSHIHAHADHTAHRSLVDTNALLGGDGPASFGVAVTRISAEVLERIADMCARQEERFRLAGDELEADVQRITSGFVDQDARP